MGSSNTAVSELSAVAEKYDLALIILHGSQAKGTAKPGSDYDIAVLRREGALDADQMLHLLLDLGQALGSERVDLVDLHRASPLLKYEAVRSAQVLYEAKPGTFNLFHVLAWKLYQDDHYDLRRLDRLYVQQSLRRLIHDGH